MRIIIIGDGKLGRTLAEKLADEGHDIVMIDHSSNPLAHAADSLDVMTLQGNGAVFSVQRQAGVQNADLLIAATSSDETNMLCCLFAQKLGARYTIARVRNPEYAEQLSALKEDFGLSYYISPEMQTAAEINRILRYPPVLHVESFAKNRSDLIEMPVEKGSILDGVFLRDLCTKIHTRVLICAVQSGEEVYIPGGDYQLKAGDRISFVAADPKSVDSFFHAIGFSRGRMRNVMIVGGGITTMTIAHQLLESGTTVKIFEINRERCDYLSKKLPGAIVINEDGTSAELLDEEGLANQDAFISLTGMDEENIVMGMYAHMQNVKKIITKVERASNLAILKHQEIGTVVSARTLTVNRIMQYIHSMQNATADGIVSQSSIVNDSVNVLEFRISPDSNLQGIPIGKIKFRKNLLIAAISRRGRTIIPGAADTFEFGDTILVITTNDSITSIQDILA